MSGETFPYDVIVGLETHVQLQTKTKLFCRCSTKFGEPANTQTCPVCIGLPGAMPVMNREAFKLGMEAAIALNCEIPQFTKWDRKNYYYPDLPKGYQISQYDLPMSQNGWLEIFDVKGEFAPKRVGIIRAHLEEDAGKSLHDEVAGKADTRIDLNRAGTPLLEIVSAPDMRSPKEAKAYLNELKLILMYLNVSDCNMQEGSLRVDANVNLHIHTPDGVKKTPIVEVKNLNSFRGVERAIAYEATRQYEVWQATGQVLGQVPKQTRGWDDPSGKTLAQRHKEESSDYRYFPEPDLNPVTVYPEEVDAVRKSMCELPQNLRERLQKEYAIPLYDADVITGQFAPLVAYFEKAAQLSGDGKRTSNFVQQEVLRTLNEKSWTLEQFPVPAEQLADLVKKVSSGELEVTRSKDVFNSMVDNKQTLADAMKALGIEKVDQGALEALCRELVTANPKIVADVKSGKQQAVMSLIGQAKKKNPNVLPGDVKQMCLDIIEKM